MCESKMEEKNKHKKGSFRLIFMHADHIDVFLMVLGFIGAVGDGFTSSFRFFVISKVMNSFGETITSFDPEALVQHVNENAIILCYFAAAASVFAFLEGYCWTRTGERQARRMRQNYLRAVLRQDVSYFDLKVTNVSDVITSVSADSLVIQDCISEKVPNFLMNTSHFIGSYLTAFLLQWRLAIVSFPFIVFLVIPGILYGRILMNLARKLKIEYNKAGNVAEQAISSIRTVYAFVGETKTMAKFSAALEGSVKIGLKQGLAKGVTIGSSGVTFTIWAFNVWYGSKLVMYHGASGGTVFIASGSLIVGGLSLGPSLSNLKYFSEAAATSERIMEVIKRVPKIDPENMEGLTLEKVSGDVEFKNVEFAYPSRPEAIIFRNFSLRVPAGRTVALVGESGSGKSTAIALLQRFYDPIAGGILLDGVSIDKIQLKWLRSQMGLVSQEPALFATSIKENIIFGKEDATLEEITKAAEASNAHNFITQFPQGYDTQVGERGVQMSGGQKQRIAIARAIIKKPSLLLLDEATSALDSESERVVQEALDVASAGRTTIVVAHRLSTIRNADMIAVIQNGHIMELGSHDELITQENGLYNSLVRLEQTKKPKDKKSLSLDTTSSHSSNLISEELINSMGSQKCSVVSRSSSVKSDGLTHDLANNEQGSVSRDQDNRPLPSFKRLLAFNLPEWKHAVFGCFNAMLYGAVQPTYGLAMGSMISVLFLQDHEEIKKKTRTYALLFLGFTAISLVLNIGQHYYLAYMGEYLSKRVKERMLSTLLTFEVGWFDQDENSSGALCSKLAKDANVVRSLVGDQMALLIQTISAVVIAFTISLIITWRLAIVMIAVEPLFVACYYTRNVLLKSMIKKVIKSQEESGKLAAEAVSNVRTIIAFSSQGRILAMLEQAQQGPRRESIRNSWYAGMGLGVVAGVTMCIWALDFWYGGKLIAHRYLTAKEFFIIFAILMSTGRIIANAGSMTTNFSIGTNVLSSIFAILDRTTLIMPDDSEGYTPTTVNGHIEINDVSFAYPTRPGCLIFQGFSIEIEPGKSVALAGHSGSGKSTIIGLMERFYDPIKGVVKIDGRDIRTYNLRSLRKHISLVSQEPTLFAGTIRENIVYGVGDDIAESEITEAARAANAHDFIAGLKDGYDTWCGDKGVQLSGGQKQRIAITRAILRNPSVLLLDEATSALDNQSEKIVQDALEKVMVGKTCVVVAHKLSTIQNCDMIAVLDKGKIIEKGTHSSLLAKGPGGAYYTLMNLQRVSHDIYNSD